MDWNSYDAALFDLDGVLTPTATVHMQAWSEMFNDFLAGQDGQDPYTERDYYAYVDGKPRYDGVRSFLESRGIELPELTVSIGKTTQGVRRHLASGKLTINILPGIVEADFNPDPNND